MKEREDDPSLSLGPVPDDQGTLIERRSEPALTQTGSGIFALQEAFFSAPAAPPLPLSRLGEYEILAELGRGGMGIVYKARHVRLGRIVALKMIIGGTLARTDDLARFETEAAAAAHLQHPGIVGLYEVGTYENQPYFSMEFISGSSLSVVLEQGPLPGRRAAAYLEAVARSVHYAHTRGILHRDLKPANVLLDENDQPKVTDFGLAKLMATDSGQTRTGAVLGTPSYMSPEQAAGNKNVSPAGDVYSLGAILYELLTGAPPFRGETALATLKLVAEKEPVPPRLLNPDIDRDLETICLKCLEKDPGRRYASAEKLAEDLHRFQSGEPIEARRLGPLGRAVKWCRRKPALATLLFVTISAVLGFILFQHETAREEAELRKNAEKAQRLALVREEGMRHLLYLSEIRRAQQALEHADLDSASRLLLRWVPPSTPTDLRDWEWYFLKERIHGKFSINAHPGRAVAVAYRPDGKRLATAGGEPTKPGEIKIWDTATGKLLATLKGHANSISALAYSPQGDLLASASYDKTVKIWDPAKESELLTLKGHTAHVLAVAFAPTEPLIASAGGDRTVRIWSYAALRKGDKTAVRVLSGHTKDVSSVAFSPDGSVLASGGFDGLVRLWDPRTGAEKDTLKGHEGEVHAVAFSPSGKVLASGGGKGNKRGEVKLWETATGKLGFSRNGLSDRVLSLAFSKEGKLVAASSDGILRLWDQAVSSEAHSFRGDPQLVYAVTFSPSGRHLAWASRSGRVWIANTSGGLETISFPAPHPIEAVTLNPAGRFLACAGGSSREAADIQVWNLDQPEKPILFKGHSGTILALAFSPDGRRLATGGDDRVIRIYDLQDPEKEPLKLSGHTGRIRGLAFRPDGALLASASEDETVRLWDPRTGAFHRALPGHKNHVLSVAFSPDNRLLASGSIDKTIRVWDVESFESVELTGHTGWVNAVAFSPDSQQLASAGQDKTVRLWDLLQKREYVKLEGSPSPVIGLAYHPGGRRLVAASQDRTLRLWDLVTRQEILELEEASGTLRAVAFSKDGRFLAAAGLNIARIWDAGTELPKRTSEAKP